MTGGTTRRPYPGDGDGHDNRWERKEDEFSVVWDWDREHKGRDGEDRGDTGGRLDGTRTSRPVGGGDDRALLVLRSRTGRSSDDRGVGDLVNAQVTSNRLTGLLKGLLSVRSTPVSNHPTRPVVVTPRGLVTDEGEEFPYRPDRVDVVRAVGEDRQSPPDGHGLIRGVLPESPRQCFVSFFLTRRFGGRVPYVRLLSRRSFGSPRLTRVDGRGTYGSVQTVAIEDSKDVKET